MSLDMVKVTLTAAADGTDNDNSKVISGEIVKIYVDYSASSAAGTDVTIKTDTAPTETILTLTNNKTDGWYYPAHVLNDATGTAVTYDGTNEIYEKFEVNDAIDFSVAQNTQGETVTIYVYYKRRD